MLPEDVPAVQTTPFDVTGNLSIGIIRAEGLPYRSGGARKVDSSVLFKVGNQVVYQTTGCSKVRLLAALLGGARDVKLPPLPFILVKRRRTSMQSRVQIGSGGCSCLVFFWGGRSQPD